MKKEEKKKKKHILLKLIFKTLFSLVAIVAVIIGCFAFKGYMMYVDAKKTTPIDEMKASIMAKDNYTKLEEINPIYIDAVVAVEDHRFYEHSGVDILAIAGAIINDISNNALIQGGSTITQQLCKNIYFTQDRRLERKFAELFMALDVERNWTKDEILEFYINTCFYGNGCYTLKEASNLYFNKEPSDLSDYEAIMLAGVPNAPSLYNPIYSEKLAKERMAQVLYAMVKYGKITEQEKESIMTF